MYEINLRDIVSVLIFLITYLVLQPLKTELRMLAASVDKLVGAMERLNRESSETVMSVKSAHKRIDEFGDRLQNIESRCENCCKGR